MFSTQVPGADELSHGGMLYLAPVGSAGTPPRPVKWPKLIGKSVVYSLTAWNPMGRDAPHEKNVEANQRLQADPDLAPTITPILTLAQNPYPAPRPKPNPGP